MKKSRKLLTKLFALVLSLLLTVPMFTGCMAGDDEDEYIPEGATVIYMSIWDSGYGVKWMEDIIKAYNAKETGVYVKMDPTALRDKAILPVMAKSDYDIVVADNSGVVKESIYPNIIGYDSTYVEITDVMQSKYGTEDVTLEEKMLDDVKNFAKVNNKYYFMPLMVNYWGMTYNADILKNYYLPRTSYEFEKLCKELPSSIKPIIFSGDTDYWDPVLWTWWAQYAGYDEYKAFWNAEDVTGKKTADIFASKARLRALETTERMLRPSNGYCDSDSTGLEYMQAQIKYLSGGYAFMANGGWLEAEMREIFAGQQHATIDYLETPVISAIVEKLSFYTDTGVDFYSLDATKMAQYDAKLCEIVSYVDGGQTGTKPSGVTEGDIAIVKGARDIFYLDGVSFAAMIPCYAEHVTEAKDFLKFLYSNEAAKIMLDGKIGAMMPIEHNFLSETEKANLPSTIKTVSNLLSNKKIIHTFLNSPYVYQGGLADFRTAGTMEALFGSVNSKDRKTPMEIFMEDYTYYHTGSAWKNLLESVNDAPIIG